MEWLDSFENAVTVKKEKIHIVDASRVNVQNQYVALRYQPTVMPKLTFDFDVGSIFYFYENKLGGSASTMGYSPHLEHTGQSRACFGTQDQDRVGFSVKLHAFSIKSLGLNRGNETLGFVAEARIVSTHKKATNGRSSGFVAFGCFGQLFERVVAQIFDDPGVIRGGGKQLVTFPKTSC